MTFTVDNITYTIIDSLNVSVSGFYNLPSLYTPLISTPVPLIPPLISPSVSYNSSNFIRIPPTVTDPNTLITYSVNEIADYAFQNCSNLINIILPNTLIRIGKYAFDGCSSLTNIKIPASTTIIDDYCFQNCSVLQEFVILGNIIPTFGTDVFINTTPYPLTVYTSNIISLPPSLFPLSLTTFTAIDFVIYSIIDSTTVSVTSFDNINAPNPWNLTLTSTVQDPNTLITYNVISIDPFAFINCFQLATITIPDSITSIGGSVFTFCNILTAVTFTGTSTIPSIENFTFYGCSSLITIVIPDSVTSIGGNAFRDCYSLPSIVIPNLVSYLGAVSFYNCISLASVTFGPSSPITIINDSTFYGCTILATIVNFPPLVTSIENNAFRQSGLTSIIIPNLVTYIGVFAFLYCYSLTSVTFAPTSTIATIDNSAFAGTPILSITFPKSVTTLEAGVFGSCSSLSNVTFVTPSQITTIGDSTFNNNFSLETIAIPDSVTTINNGAFINCYILKNITMNNNVTSIASNAFNGCWAIQSPSPTLPVPPSPPYLGTLYTNSLPGQYVYDYFLPAPSANNLYLNYVNTNPPAPPAQPTCFLRTVNLGAIRGKGSSTRMFNFCKRTNSNFYCLSTFNCNL